MRCILGKELAEHKLTMEEQEAYEAIDVPVSLKRHSGGLSIVLHLS
jgi:hypothetical protein